MHDYQVIRTEADVQVFQERSNGLHDGYITHISYDNSGISCRDGGLAFDYDGTRLVIHVLVTSLRGHPTFEIVFQTLSEWQMNDYHFSDMIGFSILFLDDGRLLWGNDTSSRIEDLKRGCYVIAESIRYRML